MLCGLVANTQYVYKVRSMVGSDYSDFVLDTFATFPNAPKAPSTVVVEPLSDSSIGVSWNPPATYVTNFIKKYKVQNDSHLISTELPPSQYSLILYGLTPFEQYNFTVSVIYTNNSQYAAHSMTGRTKEGIPNAATCQCVSNIGSTVATLSWMQPSHLNGILKQYEVVLHDQLGEIIPHHFTTNTSLPLHLLHPSTLYTFSVRAYNSEGVGPYCNEPSEFTTNSSVLGSTVEVEIVFEYSLAHFYSLNEQVEIFIEQLITSMSNVTGVNKDVFTGPHFLHTATVTTVTTRVVVLPTQGTASATVADNLISKCDSIVVLDQTAQTCNRIVDPAKGYSSDQNDVNSDTSEKLLVSCVLISIAFNILFIVIICFVFKKNRALAKSNRHL